MSEESWFGFTRYPLDNPKFMILKNAVWWKEASLQKSFKDIRLEGPYSYGSMEHFVDKFSYGINAPFSETTEFGNGSNREVYICESLAGWGAALTRLRGALSSKETDVKLRYSNVMKIVNEMEAKLANLEGVYNRDKFNKEFLPTSDPCTKY